MASKEEEEDPVWHHSLPLSAVVVGGNEGRRRRRRRRRRLPLFPLHSFSLPPIALFPLCHCDETRLSSLSPSPLLSSSSIFGASFPTIPKGHFIDWRGQQRRRRNGGGRRQRNGVQFCPFPSFLAFVPFFRQEKNMNSRAGFGRELTQFFFAAKPPSLPLSCLVTKLPRRLPPFPI